MRGRLLVPVLAAAVASVGALSSCATADAVPAASIDLTVAAPQQVALDPTGTSVDLSYSATGCSNGCALVRVRTLRANVEEKQVDLRTFADAGRRVFRVRDAVTAEPALGWSTSYEVRVFRTAAHTTYTVAAAVQATPTFAGENAFRYDSGWRRELNSGVTETLIQRSWTPGATATLPANPLRRKLGLIAAKGPNNGVLRISVNGRPTQTLDLRATSWQARQVVAAVDVPAKAVLTVQNATPAGRAARDVHVDGLVTLPVQALATNSAVRTTRGDTRPAAAAPAPVGESVDARVRTGQQLPATGGEPVLDVTARVFGCPTGCTLVRRTYDMNGATDAVLLERTSPASSTLQTLSATDPRPFSSDAMYVLQKNDADVTMSSGLSPVLVPAAQIATSYGWVKENNASYFDGSAWRSSTPGTGVTYRANGAFEGRNVAVVAAKGPRAGVLAVHADGRLLQSIDLYSATAQPRQVVASVDLASSGRITVANRTPATRANKDVVVDDLVLLERPDDYY
jgi:hypothetical protein